MNALPTALDSGPFAIQTSGISKRYGTHLALDGVDLQVPEGAVYLLIGPNGAGKSTTLRTLLGLTPPDSGSVSVFGLDVARHGPQVRARIGYVPEQLNWGYGFMRVQDLLDHHAAFYTAWDRGYLEVLSKAFSLKLDRRVSRLSKGEARRVHLTLALAHRPSLLVFDEPTDGLDPVMLDETMALLADHLAESPTTVIISTHHVHEIDKLADHVGVMRDGRLMLQSTRGTLHQRLRRYRAEVPDGWAGAPSLEEFVLRRGAVGREIQWSIWGDEREVVQRLAVAGAVVRDVSPLTLDDAALALLSRKPA
jgi:ABC-2 type transport system ATP-binding protein